MKQVEKLALEGGPKVIDQPLATEWPGLNWIGDEERQVVAAAVNPQSHPGNLPEDLYEFYGYEWAHPTSSGNGCIRCRATHRNHVWTYES